MVNKYKSVVTNTWFKLLAALIFSCILVLSAARLHPAKQAEQGASLETMTAHLESRIPELMKTYEIPGVSMALVQNNKVVWTQAFGFADIEAGRKMTANTICRVQSISKPVTAWGVMKLVEQDKIDIDKPVSFYLKNWTHPESEFSEKDITIRQLLSHSAGMPLGDILTRYAPQEDMPSLEEKLSMEAHLIQEPGTSFSYSNTGYNLLELLIQEVTGMRYAEYMEQEILDPLGMAHASFEWSLEFDPPVPVGYNLKGEEIPVYVYPEKASGGLFATAEDIAKFALAGMQDSPQEVLSTASIDELYKPMAKEMGMYSLVFDAYGLGHYIENIPVGGIAVSHGGQGTGCMTHFHAVPEKGDAIVILTNSQRSWPFISYIMSDWAEWNGFSSVGMEAILFGQKVLWGIIGLTWFTVFLQAIRLAEGLILKKRRFAPFAKDARFLRAVQGGMFVVLSAILIWCISQPYLDITSIFPRASGWLGISILASAVVLLLSAFFPKRVNMSHIR